MVFNRAVMTIGGMIGATEYAKARVRDLLKQAEEVAKDARKKERLARNECKACFYGGRIGGCSTTKQECMCCGTAVWYASTATSTLCLECAKAHTLCQRCGGDLEMRTRRKDWPLCPPNSEP